MTRHEHFFLDDVNYQSCSGNKQVLDQHATSFMVALLFDCSLVPIISGQSYDRHGRRYYLHASSQIRTASQSISAPGKRLHGTDHNIVRPQHKAVFLCYCIAESPFSSVSETITASHSHNNPHGTHPTLFMSLLGCMRQMCIIVIGLCDHSWILICHGKGGCRARSYSSNKYMVRSRNTSTV